MGPLLLRLLPAPVRRARIRRLMTQLDAWEADGRALVCQIIELTDPGDDAHLECLRILELLEI